MEENQERGAKKSIGTMREGGKESSEIKIVNGRPPAAWVYEKKSVRKKQRHPYTKQNKKAARKDRGSAILHHTTWAYELSLASLRE